MAAPEDALRERLVDPRYWRPRLEGLAQRPRSLTQIPRPDLCRPGIDVVELRMHAHDGVQLEALMAHSTFHRRGGSVHLRVCSELANCALDWGAVEQGLCDVVFAYPEPRRLEDRVLDVLRIVESACVLQQVEGECVGLYSGHQNPPQEFVIADLLRQRGLA